MEQLLRNILANNGQTVEICTALLLTHRVKDMSSDVRGSGIDTVIAYDGEPNRFNFVQGHTDVGQLRSVSLKVRTRREEVSKSCHVSTAGAPAKASCEMNGLKISMRRRVKKGQT